MLRTTAKARGELIKQISMTMETFKSIDEITQFKKWRVLGKRLDEKSVVRS